MANDSLQDRMAKLVLSVDTNVKKGENENKKAKRSPFSPTQNIKKQLQQTPKSSKTPQSKNTKLDDFWGVDIQDTENSPTFVQGTPLAPPSLSESRRKRTPRPSTGTV